MKCSSSLVGMQTQAMKAVDVQQKSKAMLKEERWQEDILARSWVDLVGYLVDPLESL